MKCPVCKDVTLLMSERKGIEIDYCPECRGIWLDRGELDKLLEKEDTYNKEHRNNYEHHEKSNYQEHYPHDEDDYYKNHKDGKYPYKKRKRESFVGEIFDIFGGD